MNPREIRNLRQRNYYFNAMTASTPEPRTVNGQMGQRDSDSGRYFTSLDDGGSVSTEFIGLSDSRPQGFTTQLDLDGWADN